MITLHEKLDVERPPHEVFAYLRDFRTTTEWDATATDASKLTPGPITPGTRFEVICKLPVGSVTLTYTLVRMEPDQTLELHGSCGMFSVTDIIHLTETSSGTHIDYRAQFTFKPLLAVMEGSLRAGLERMAKSSMEGLSTALADNFAAPAASAATVRADRWVLPGVAMFTRAGYRRGQRNWQPMSTWAGDKHVVITGASSGLGRAAALRLAELGTSLTLVIRDENKAAALMNELRRETGNDRIHIELADLSLMSEVTALARRLELRNHPIDVLINNAGALFNDYAVTAEGIEQSFALLLLSPYRLTRSLLPLLRAAPAARVINVVSGGMYTQPLDISKLEASPGDYAGSTAYARNKRALMVLTEQWAQEWAEYGISVNAMHPGWADTPGVKDSLPGFHKLTRLVLRSPDEGADTTVWLAVAREAGLCTGQLFLDREPRSTHLLESTRSDESERNQLRPFLDSFAVKHEGAGATGRNTGGLAYSAQHSL